MSVRLYFNQSGNGWSDAQVLNVHPKVDEIINIVPTDLLGNGTACLVWSSPLPGDAGRQMRYVNLMGDQKPHLLVRTKNNLGAETEIHYAPSTKFYLADKVAGNPWVTKLPFPVHVVEMMVVRDTWRETRFATTYSYHHGFFDGVEREFRGFGRVEQVDVETFGAFAEGNASSPYIDDDQTLYQPPVKTVSWFHTGAALEREQVLSQYQHEYVQVPDFSENFLPEPDLPPDDLTGEEWREALRACKGLPLRTEVYELDVDALDEGEQWSVRLFSTAFHNCHIQMLQPQTDNRHAVFLVTESEAITYQYDLDLGDPEAKADPRIAHTLNLKTDEYGNVLQSVAVVYPRIGAHIDDPLLGDTNTLINRVQKDRHLAYTETRFTDYIDFPGDVENYRLRLPCEVLTYELTEINPDGSHFTLEELLKFNLSPDEYPNARTEVAPLQYHELPNLTSPQKRIVEHVRMLFFDADLKVPLLFRKLNSLALPYEAYTLALTDDLLSAVIGDTKLAPVLPDLNDPEKSGYFIHGDTPGHYWIRSGIAGFADVAKDRFYLPEKYTDPFGKTTVLNYDPQDLFIQSSEDPAGNTVSVEKFDYRVLAPRETKDINDNLSEVIFETLGMPTAVAVKGNGDNFLGFDSEPEKPAERCELTKSMQNYLDLHRHSAVRTELLTPQ